MSKGPNHSTKAAGLVVALNRNQSHVPNTTGHTREAHQPQTAAYRGTSIVAQRLSGFLFLWTAGLDNRARDSSS